MTIDHKKPPVGDTLNIDSYLHIPSIKATFTEIKDDAIYIHAVPADLDLTTEHCFAPPLIMQDLSIGEKKVYIILYRPKRRGRVRNLDFYPPKGKKKFTTRFEQRILVSLVHNTSKDVAIEHQLSYDQVKGILKRNVRKKIDWKSLKGKKIETLGLDEIALKKGQRNFVTVVTGIVEGKLTILAVLKDRKKATVAKFLRSIPKKTGQRIGAFCSDLYDGFIGAVIEVFGVEALRKVVADRFHVAKLYREGVDKLRMRIMRQLKKKLSKKKYEELKGVMWALRRRPEELTGEEWKALEKLFVYAPLLKEAYILSNELTEIFDGKILRHEAAKKIRRWMEKVTKSPVGCFDGFLKTLKERFDIILNYFKGRKNSGFVEGLNQKIKLLKRRGYGMFNIESLYRQIYLDLHGYEEFGQKG